MAMAQLGDFVFHISTAAFQAMSRTHSFEWSSQKRIGTNPSMQYTGFSKTIELSECVIYPSRFGNKYSLPYLVELAEKGKPLMLILGDDSSTEYEALRVYRSCGFWAIASISESQTLFMANGFPRKIVFSLSLQYYGEKY